MDSAEPPSRPDAALPLSDSLRPEQQAAVGAWLPDAALVADHSWDGAGRAVLRIRHAGHDVVVKAGRRDDHHMVREIRAHREFVAALAERGLAARMLHAAPDLQLLATTYPRCAGRGHGRGA